MTNIIYPGTTYGYVDARDDLDAKADLKVLSAPASSTDHWTHLITSQVFGEMFEQKTLMVTFLIIRTGMSQWN